MKWIHLESYMNSKTICYFASFHSAFSFEKKTMKKKHSVQFFISSEIIIVSYKATGGKAIVKWTLAGANQF